MNNRAVLWETLVRKSELFPLIKEFFAWTAWHYTGVVHALLPSIILSENRVPQLELYISKLTFKTYALEETNAMSVEGQHFSFPATQCYEDENI